MPRMGGPELVEKLRRKRPDFRVIFMSGYTEAALIENASVGTNALLLSKPFSTETLVHKILEAQKAGESQREADPGRAVSGWKEK